MTPTKTPLASAIWKEAQKLVIRHQNYATQLAEDLARIERRGMPRPQKQLRVPGYWAVASGYDPYHVRAECRHIASSIAEKLRRGKYQPYPAITYQIPKGAGGTRTLNVFQIADNTVSRLLYKKLLAKNARQLHGKCYAYREDLTIHDAIAHLALDLQSAPRFYLAEFDLSKYFDCISHSHIWRQLDSGRYYITSDERKQIEAFLTAPVSSPSSYPYGQRRTVGIPQGTSISLFLANVAGFPIDQALEKLGVSFARYADDTVVWSTNYSSVSSAVDVLHRESGAMGVELNLSKSDGIHILTPESKIAEFRHKTAVTYVGYRAGSAAVSIADKAVARMKEKLSRLIYRNLLEGPYARVAVDQRLGPSVDWDYITMIYQVRRYLYGGLTERRIRSFSRGRSPVMHFKGFMSSFPLVNDERQLKALDGWLVHTIWTSMRTRTQVLRTFATVAFGLPHQLPIPKLLALRTFTFGSQTRDLTVPSFVRVARMLRHAATLHGPNAIANWKSLRYYGRQ